MNEELKKQLEESNKILADLQDKLKNTENDKKTYEDKVNSLSSEAKEQVKKIEASLDEKDKTLQKIQTEKDAHETKIRHLEESIKEIKDNNGEENLKRIKDMEIEIANLSNMKPSDAKQNKKHFGKEYEGLQDYVMKGIEPEEIVKMNNGEILNNQQIPTDKKYLRTDSNADGGFLVPDSVYNQIMEEVEEIDPVRALCRKFASKVKSLSVAIRTTLPVAYYEGESESDQEDESTYRFETLTAYRLGLTSKITWDSLNFSMTDMISQLTKDAAMGFAQKENYCFLLGTGKKQPEGILVNSDITDNTVDSASSGVVGLADVIGLLKYPKSGYLPNARFAMNQSTLYTLRVEKDTAGNFLWRPGGETMPNQIAGKPFVIMPNMADIAGSSLSVMVGDFFYGYYILDAVGISLIRDDYTSKRTGIVEFTWKQWNNGQVAIAEAFKVLKTAA
jgi:HK97 family phage major capsid protein